MVNGLSKVVGDGKKEVSPPNGIRRKMASFEQLFSLFTDSRCFKYSGRSIDSLSRCCFILEHILFRFSISLPLSFFFPSFLSRQIFVSVKRFYRLHVTRNVSNDCFPISTEFCIILTNFSPYDITNRERFLFIYKNIRICI